MCALVGETLKVWNLEEHEKLEGGVGKTEQKTAEDKDNNYYNCHSEHYFLKLRSKIIILSLFCIVYPIFHGFLH